MRAEEVELWNEWLWLNTTTTQAPDGRLNGTRPKAMYKK